MEQNEYFLAECTTCRFWSYTGFICCGENQKILGLLLTSGKKKRSLLSTKLRVIHVYVALLTPDAF